MPVENLAVRRYVACIGSEFRMNNNRKPTGGELASIVAGGDFALGSKVDKVVLRNDAGVIRESQVRKIQKTIFERKR